MRVAKCVDCEKPYLKTQKERMAPHCLSLCEPCRQAAREWALAPCVTPAHLEIDMDHEVPA